MEEERGGRTGPQGPRGAPILSQLPGEALGLFQAEESPPAEKASLAAGWRRVGCGRLQQEHTGQRKASGIGLASGDGRLT